MPDDPIQTSDGVASPTPETTPRASLREIAEQSWDEVQEAAESDDEPELESAPATGQDGRRRDNLGRFAAADPQQKPGEQSDDPAPKDNSASGAAKPDPAAQASSNQQPPQHWSEQDRNDFAKLPPEGQAFLLRRHTEMERAYQAKTQAAATAVQFTNSLAPLFQDPVISGSLVQAKLSPFEAIGQWAGFHRRAMDPNPEVRRQLLGEMAQRMGLDPATAGQPSRPGLPGGLSEADMQDPAIRYFADHIGKALSGVEALRGEFQQMQNAAAERQQQEVLKVTRWGIDSFAEEKDAEGNLKRPHFDAVLPIIIELFRANPERDLQEAYEMAIWSNPQVRSQLIAADQAKAEKARQNERARLAVRSNVRGVTSPVTKPTEKPKGLRATIEAAADEAGL